MEVTTGILLGLSTLLFIGPVFFYLIKSTLEHGIFAGISVAIGIIIGDIIYVLLIVEGLAVIIDDYQYKKWFALFGGLLLMMLGLKYIFRPTPRNRIQDKLSVKSFWIYAVNGFLLNFVNPFVLAVWIGFFSINQSKFQDKSSIVISLSITLFVIFATDCLKVLFAQKLKPYIKNERLKVVYKFFGIIMILFGIRLLMFYLS